MICWFIQQNFCCYHTIHSCWILWKLNEKKQLFGIANFGFLWTSCTITSYRNGTININVRLQMCHLLHKRNWFTGFLCTNWNKGWTYNCCDCLLPSSSLFACMERLQLYLAWSRIVMNTFRKMNQERPSCITESLHHFSTYVWKATEQKANC